MERGILINGLWNFGKIWYHNIYNSHAETFTEILSTLIEF